MWDLIQERGEQNSCNDSEDSRMMAVKLENKQFRLELLSTADIEKSMKGREERD